jgi:tRNA pseudouridine13 synthase
MRRPAGERDALYATSKCHTIPSIIRATMVASLPYLTADIPPLGGRIKSRPSDFQVEEVPLYEPSGKGTHSYFFIEKTGMSTLRAVREVARALGEPHRNVGYAGMKDANAITRQVFSIEHVPPERIEHLEIPNLRVLWVRPHTNKLRLGHLWGNRFIIRLRGADIGRLDEVRRTLAVLSQRGVPNYFGEQRFGVRGDTWEIGRAMMRQDWVEAVCLMLGRPSEHDRGEVLRARRLFEEGKYEEAARTWPYPFPEARRACLAMARSKGSHKRAFFSVDKAVKRLYLSAYQSHLFNRVVAERIGMLGQLRAGDLAYRHANGAVFRVVDPAVEQPRADAFEISPSGPLFGYRMTEPEGEALEIESRLLASEGLAPSNFRIPGAHKIKGARRPLRFQPKECDVTTGSDDLGDFYEFRFFLEPGCYATMLLREICKTGLAESEDAS